MKEEFAEGVNNKCDGNEDWRSLKRKLLDVSSEICGYTKGNLSFLKRGGRIKMWMWVCVERELFRIWNIVAMKKLGRNILRQKKDVKRVVYMAMDQKARKLVEKVYACRDGRELFRIAKKGQGRREMLLGLVVLKMKVVR